MRINAAASGSGEGLDVILETRGVQQESPASTIFAPIAFHDGAPFTWWSAEGAKSSLRSPEPTDRGQLLSLGVKTHGKRVHAVTSIFFSVPFAQEHMA